MKSHVNIADRYAIFGHPIMHSRSPVLFEESFRAHNLHAHYLKIDAVSPQEVVRLAGDLRLRGFNITSPLKTSIIPCLNVMDDAALNIGAVNTVRVRDNKFTGYNTDYYGIHQSLKSIDTKGRKIVVVGSGGAARAVLFALHSEKIKNVSVINRTFHKIEQFEEKYNYKIFRLSDMASVLINADIIINCIPLGINLIDKKFLKKDMTVIDANYYSSRLLADASDAGCTTIDGLQWLSSQFIKSFEILTGKYGKTAGFEALEIPQPDSKPLALIGFMGTGKTLIGAVIAKKKTLRLIDTDMLIEKAVNMKIPEIFEKSGEEGFRKIEASTIRNIKFNKNSVYCFGGGAVLNPENRLIINENCNVVLLWSSMDIVIKRIENSDRPLYKKMNPAQFSYLLNSRLDTYIRTADFLISNESDPEKIADRIIVNVY